MQDDLHPEYERYLAHHGVKGMRWGVRKDGGKQGSSANPKTTPSKRTTREASKDAKEFNRAKMFYGEGAGTRRKLIKATVTSKAKKDPLYKKAFDEAVATQDMGKHASKARSERKRKDVKNTTAKTARGVKNTILRTGAPVTGLGLAIGVAYQNPQVKAAIDSAGKKTYAQAKKALKNPKIKKTTTYAKNKAKDAYGKARNFR